MWDLSLFKPLFLPHTLLEAVSAVPGFTGLAEPTLKLLYAPSVTSARKIKGFCTQALY